MTHKQKMTAIADRSISRSEADQWAIECAECLTPQYLEDKRQFEEANPGQKWLLAIHPQNRLILAIETIFGEYTSEDAIREARKTLIQLGEAADKVSA